MRAPFRAAIVIPALAALALGACTGEPIESESEEAESAAEESSEDASAAGSEGETAPEPAEPADLEEGIAATVGDVEITDEQVDARVELQGLAGTPEAAGAASNVLSQLVQVELVRQYATSELGLDLEQEIDGPAVSAKVAEVVEAAGGREAYEATAAAQGIAAEDAQALAQADAEVQVLVDIVQESLVEQLPDDAVDEDALRQEYEQDPSAYQSSDVAHILVETEEQAQEALQRLEDGEDFGDLARELSTGPSAPDGGELGVAPRGSYVEEFSAAVYAEGTEPGDVVGPVETQFGFHVIRVNDIITPPFEEVLATARAEAVGPQFQTFVQDAFAAVEVAVDEQYGVWDPATATVVPEGGPAAGVAPSGAGSAGSEAPSDSASAEDGS